MMKKEILTLVIGILIGAIITTGVFLLLKGNTRQNNMDTGNMRERMGNPPAMQENTTHDNTIGIDNNRRESIENSSNTNELED